MKMNKLGMKNKIIWYLFGGIIQKIAAFGDKIHISGLFILCLPIFILLPILIVYSIKDIKTAKKTIQKATDIMYIIILPIVLFVISGVCIHDQVNRVNLGIPVYFDYKPSKSCILKCYTDLNKIEIVLNAEYIIGNILGGGIGDIEFAEYYTDNFNVTREDKIIIITVNDDISIFENMKYYKIYIKWAGGYVETFSKYENGLFIIENEHYYNKTSFM